MVYQVIKNGNVLVDVFDTLKAATRKFFVIEKRGDYVEIWACFPDESRILVLYAN